MGNNTLTLNERMKEYYENRSKTYLTRRTPVIIRLDGKAFHTFTRGLQKPYDEIFHNCMNNTTKYLCENIQGCKIGYTQSDEITLLITDYDTLTTSAWFDYNVQKLCSITASMATMAFNKFFSEEYKNYMYSFSFKDIKPTPSEKEYMNTLYSKLNTAMFDSRCFNVPEAEVCNCFIWRQQDAIRNNTQMLGQCNFSDKQ